MKKNERSREFWEEAVAGTEASSLTRGKMAKELGVGHPALSYWIYKLRAERQGKSSRALVPVRVLAPELSCQELLELKVDDVVVRFSSATAPEYARKARRSLAHVLSLPPKVSVYLWVERISSPAHVEQVKSG